MLLYLSREQLRKHFQYVDFSYRKAREFVEKNKALFDEPIKKFREQARVKLVELREFLQNLERFPLSKDPKPEEIQAYITAFITLAGQCQSSFIGRYITLKLKKNNYKEVKMIISRFEFLEKEFDRFVNQIPSEYRDEDTEFLLKITKHSNLSVPGYEDKQRYKSYEDYLYDLNKISEFLKEINDESLSVAFMDFYAFNVYRESVVSVTNFLRLATVPERYETESFRYAVVHTVEEQSKLLAELNASNKEINALIKQLQKLLRLFRLKNAIAAICSASPEQGNLKKKIEEFYEDFFSTEEKLKNTLAICECVSRGQELEIYNELPFEKHKLFYQILELLYVRIKYLIVECPSVFDDAIKEVVSSQQPSFSQVPKDYDGTAKNFLPKVVTQCEDYVTSFMVDGLLVNGEVFERDNFTNKHPHTYFFDKLIESACSLSSEQLIFKRIQNFVALFNLNKCISQAAVALHDAGFVNNGEVPELTVFSAGIVVKVREIRQEIINKVIPFCRDGDIVEDTQVKDLGLYIRDVATNLFKILECFSLLNCFFNMSADERGMKTLLTQVHEIYFKDEAQRDRTYSAFACYDTLAWEAAKRNDVIQNTCSPDSLYKRAVEVEKKYDLARPIPADQPMLSRATSPRAPLTPLIPRGMSMTLLPLSMLSPRSPFSPRSPHSPRPSERSPETDPSGRLAASSNKRSDHASFLRMGSKKLIDSDVGSQSKFTPQADGPQ